MDQPLHMLDFVHLQLQQQSILNYYQKTGYPFVSIKLDSIQIEDDKIKGMLVVDKGPLYHIDSIRVYGKAKIKNTFNISIPYWRDSLITCINILQK